MCIVSSLTDDLYTITGHVSWLQLYILAKAKIQHLSRQYRICRMSSLKWNLLITCVLIICIFITYPILKQGLEVTCFSSQILLIPGKQIINSYLNFLPRNCKCDWLLWVCPLCGLSAGHLQDFFLVLHIIFTNKNPYLCGSQNVYYTCHAHEWTIYCVQLWMRQWLRCQMIHRNQAYCHKMPWTCIQKQGYSSAHSYCWH